MAPKEAQCPVKPRAEDAAHRQRGSRGPSRWDLGFSCQDGWQRAGARGKSGLQPQLASEVGLRQLHLPTAVRHRSGLSYCTSCSLQPPFLPLPHHLIHSSERDEGARYFLEETLHLIAPWADTGRVSFRNKEKLVAADGMAGPVRKGRGRLRQ